MTAWYEITEKSETQDNEENKRAYRQIVPSQCRITHAASQSTGSIPPSSSS
jgi:hypothetical protein